MLPRRLCSVASTLAISLGLGGAAAAETPRSSSSAEPEQDYRLFVGLDVEVKLAEEFAHLDNYQPNRISTDKLVAKTVSLREVNDVRFTHAPKLGRNPLTIGEIETSRVAGTVYGGRNSMQNQQALQAYSRMQEQAGWKMLGDINSGQDTSGVEGMDAEVRFNRTLDALTEASDMMDKATDPSLQGDQLAGQESDKHTALRITTEITSPVPIQDAYIVGVIRYTTEDLGYQEKVFFKAVAKLGPEPREIKITKQGLPEECEIKNVDLHIYHSGQELVTNHSAKQFALSRAEVLEYIALERTSEHRGKTLPPEPAWSLAPPDLFAPHRPEDFDFPITLDVDASGQVTAIDPNQVVPVWVSDVARKLIFQPALEKGIPVASTTQINLRSYYP